MVSISNYHQLEAAEHLATISDMKYQESRLSGAEQSSGT
jgi:hypothetical protein